MKIKFRKYIQQNKCTVQLSSCEEIKRRKYLQNGKNSRENEKNPELIKYGAEKVAKKNWGTCAVLITGYNRSLCANLGAANDFTIDHLSDPENKKLIESAQFYYVSGFFLTVNPAAQMEMAKYAVSKNRPFVMNLSAPFICQFFFKAFADALPYTDLLFGNESEAETLSESYNFGTKNIEEIALKISELPKENENRKRTVIITQGVEPIIVASEGKIRKFPIVKLSKEKIVDTNGAGDAFAGGFLSQYILGRSLEVCIKCAAWAAAEIIQRHGCSFEGKPAFNPEL